MNNYHSLVIIIALLCCSASSAIIAQGGLRMLNQNVPSQTCFNKSIVGNCAECIYGYYYDTSASFCYKSYANCKTYFLFNGTCESCFIGFSLSEGFCIYNSSIDQQSGCSTFVNGECTACSFSYYNNSEGHCEAIDPQCKTFNYTLSVCVACYGGYSLALNQRKCLLTDLVTLGVQANPFCIQFTIACTACFTDYQLVNGICVTSTSNGSSGSNSTTNETSGSNSTSNETSGSNSTSNETSGSNSTSNETSGSNTTTYVNVNCQTFDADNKCTQCYWGYYVDITTNHCLTVNPLCASAQKIGGNCLSCYYRYYLSAGLCLQVNSLCKDFDSVALKCTSCFPGYSLNALNVCVVS